jgi:phage FluMu protein Com
MRAVRCGLKLRGIDRTCWQGDLLETAHYVGFGFLEFDCPKCSKHSLILTELTAN